MMIDFLTLFVLTLSTGVAVAQSCSQNFCHGNGNCIFEAKGFWYCKCRDSYFGSQCENVKSSFVSQFSIISLQRKNITYNGSILLKELQIKAMVYNIIRNLTESLFKTALTDISSFMNGTFIVAKNLKTSYKLQFKQGPEVTLNNLNVKIANTLLKLGYRIQNSIYSAHSVLHIKDISVRDFDECSEPLSPVCESLKTCSNTNGLFKCSCLSGYKSVASGCILNAATETNWKQISIWIGVVVIVLFWMCVAVFCSLRRRAAKQKNGTSNTTTSNNNSNNINNNNSETPNDTNTGKTDQSGPKRKMSSLSITGNYSRKASVVSIGSLQPDPPAEVKHFHNRFPSSPYSTPPLVETEHVFNFKDIPRQPKGSPGIRIPTKTRHASLPFLFEEDNHTLGLGNTNFGYNSNEGSVKSLDINYEGWNEPNSPYNNDVFTDDSINNYNGANFIPGKPRILITTEVPPNNQKSVHFPDKDY